MTSRAAAWRKSSYSHANSNCVECAPLASAVAVRDSKHPQAAHLTVPSLEWTAFLAAVKDQEL